MTADELHWTRLARMKATVLYQDKGRDRPVTLLTWRSGDKPRARIQLADGTTRCVSTDVLIEEGQ